MFSSITVKPLLLVILVLFSSTCLFGYLSYSFYGDKVQAEQALTQALSSAKSLEESLEKERLACMIDNAASSSFQQEKKEIVEKKEVILNQIDKLQEKKAPTKVPTSEGKQNEKSVASVDDGLPDDLKRLLDEAYRSTQRSAAPDA